MDYAQLGKKVKAKYSQYGDIDDVELGKKVAAKYPEYGSLIDEAPAKTSKASLPVGLNMPVGNQNLSAAMKVLGLPSNIVGGAIGGAREALTGDYQTPQVAKVNIGGKQLELGSLIHPVLAGAVRGVTQNKSVMEELPKVVGVDPDSALGTGIGLAGEIATPDPADALAYGKVAKKVVSKAGKPVKEAGEKLVTKALRPSPSQFTGFLKKTGEDLVGFITRNNLTENFVEEAGSKLGDLQSAFDEIAVSSGKKIKINDLKAAFDETIKEFSGSIAPTLKGKAEDIKAVFENIVGKYGEVVDVGDLTKERRAVDALIKEGQFSLPPEAASYYKAVRDILQESIRKATENVKVGGKGLKELGQEIHKWIEFEKIAKKQAGLGKGSNVLGFIRTLMTGTGGALGGFPGAALGFGVSTASQNPKVLSLLSQLLQSSGRGLEDSTVLPKVLELLMRGGKEEVITPR